MQSFQMEQWGKGIPILLKIAEKLDYNTEILKENTSILKENTSILRDNTKTLNDFKNETNKNLGDLKTIMSKHDLDAKERTSLIKNEIIDIKDRLSNLETAVSLSYSD